MSLVTLPLAIATLVPVMVGPMPSQPPATLVAHLCGGGSITIPLGPRKAPERGGDCHPKGCHAGTCRDDKSAKLISRKDG